MGWKKLEIRTGPQKRNVSIRSCEKKSGGFFILLTLSSVVWTEVFGSHDGNLDVLIGEDDTAGKLLLVPVAEGGIKVATMKYSHMIRFPKPEAWQELVAEQDGLSFGAEETDAGKGLVIDLPDWLIDAAAADAYAENGNTRLKKAAALLAPPDPPKDQPQGRGASIVGSSVDWSDAPPRAKEILDGIITAARGNGSDCVSLTNRALSTSTGIEVGKLLAPLAWLSKKGLLEIDHPASPGQPVTYTVVGLE
ncbi:MAG: hypothetical protein KDJ69_16895 [Nitratireductor sp.]|nr:hypothetical protein [Nitratireductor sp.]